MRVYWTFKSFPELRDLEPRLRRRVWRTCALRPYRHLRTWAVLFSQFILVLVGALVGLILDGKLWVLLWMLRGDSPAGHEIFGYPWATMLLMYLGAAVGCFLFIQFYSRMMRSELREYLERHPNA